MTKHKFRPNKLRRLSGELSHRKSFGVTYRVDKLYYLLYIKLLKKFNISFKVETRKVSNITTQYIVHVPREDVEKYIADHKGCIKRNNHNYYYISLGDIYQDWDELLEDVWK